MAQRQGDAMLQEAEMSRQATLLGMQYGQSAGANASYQQAALNQQQAGASANQMFTDSLSSLSNVNWGNLGGSINTGGLPLGYGGATTQAGYDYFNDPTR